MQKQTGADRLSLGGALAANVHGRGLSFRPIVQDVEAFTLVDARGEALRCSRTENEQLFALAIGGYGLFGVISSVRLRLSRRTKIRRIVEVLDVDGLDQRFADRIAEGFSYGDFQYATDPQSPQLLRRGVFSCYHPVPDATPIPDRQQSLSEQDWLSLLTAAHISPGKAFDRYASYYEGTHGQVYWSDTHQLSTYINDYHKTLGEYLRGEQTGSEMITEIYVPRDALGAFLTDVRRDFVEHDVDLIYGTIRLIEQDDECFMTWARQPWACVIFNLHTQHDGASLETTAGHFRRLIDHGLRYSGSYFLTYHCWATRRQVLAAHPRLPEFLALKQKHDPEGRFQSDWYRHHVELLA